jgi:hypothetical protein
MRSTRPIRNVLNGVLLLHYRDLRNLDDFLPPRAANRNASSDSFDRSRWDALVERDAELGLVAKKLRPLGQKWVDKFAESYLATNDRSHLPTLVGKIIADAGRKFEQQEGTRNRKTKRRRFR